MFLVFVKDVMHHGVHGIIDLDHYFVMANTQRVLGRKTNYSPGEDIDDRSYQKVALKSKYIDCTSIEELKVRLDMEGKMIKDVQSSVR